MNLHLNEIVFHAWNQLWQVTALVLLVGLCVRMFCKHRPHLANIMWTLVVIKCLTPPIVSSHTGVFCWAHAQLLAVTAGFTVEGSLDPAPKDVRDVTTLHLDDERGMSRVAEEVPGPINPTGGGRELAASQTTAKETTKLAAGTDSIQRSSPILTPAKTSQPTNTAARTWAIAIGVCWGVGALACFVFVMGRRIACSIVLRRSSVAVDKELQAGLRRLTRHLRVRQRVRLLVTRRTIGPAVFGVLRPTILLPKRLLEERPPEQLEQILAHELIHVRRGDTLLGLLQTIAQIVWWFHPLVWWANRQASRQRERCCDDEVVAGIGLAPATYAQTLLDVLKSTRELRSVAGFPGIRTAELTQKRLEHIMENRNRCRRTPRKYWLALLGLIFVFAPGAAISLPDEVQTVRPKPITLEMTTSGNVLVLGQEVPQQKLKPFLEQLATLRKPDAPKPAILIRAPRNTQYQHVASLIDLCKSFGNPSVTVRETAENKTTAKPDSAKEAIAAAEKIRRAPMQPIKQPIKVLLGHTDAANAVAFSTDGKWIVSGGSDDIVRLWNAKTGQEVASMNCDGDGIWTVAFSPDGRFVVCGCNNGAITVWEVKSRKLLRRIKASKNEVWSVDVSPNSRLIAVGTRNAEVQVWNAITGEKLLSVSNKSQVSGIRFTPDGDMLATSSVNEPVKLWKVLTGQIVMTTKKAPSFEQWIAVSPDSKRLASAGWTGLVFVWDAKTGALLKTLRHRGKIPLG